MNELQRCDACGRYSRHWGKLALSVDGRLEFVARLCTACVSHVTDAVKTAVKERELAR